MTVLNRQLNPTRPEVGLQTMNQTSKSELTPLDVAIDALLQNLPTVEERETVGLLHANGRILAEDCVAQMDVPSQANSAMDGYAIRSEDLDGELGALTVSQRIAAGELGVQLNSGEAARIFTGAPIPPGADAVVMQENCSLDGKQLKILQKVSSGENLRQAGEDIASGTRLFPAGHRLRPQDVGLLASIGKDQLQVRRNLKVALMTTGDELVQPGTKLKAGQIYNSNYYTLCSLLNALNVQVLDFGIIGDDFESTRVALAEAAAAADCIISTGGVSVGEEDYVKAAVEAEGSLELWKLAIKPGKPLACGKVAGTQFFGLPGNPVSAFVTFALVVRPCLLRMLGCLNPFPQRFRLDAGFVSTKSGERQEYKRCLIVEDAQSGMQLLPFANQSSGAGTSLSNTAGLAIIPPYTSVAIGDSLEFIPFSEILN